MLIEYKSIGIHWIAFSGNGNSVAYFASFGVEPIPEEINRQRQYDNRYLQNTGS